MSARKHISTSIGALGWLMVLGALVLAAAWMLERAEPPSTTAAAMDRAPATPSASHPARPTTADEPDAPSPAGAVVVAASDGRMAARGPSDAAGADTTTLSTAQAAQRADEAATAAVNAARVASPASTKTLTPLPEDTAELAARRLTLPVQGLRAAQLTDTFTDARAGGVRRHDAIDIMAPVGTPVLAVEDGRIAKLFFSQGGGGITVYQFDPGERYAYYYAHLDRYADGLQDGQAVRRGQVIGYVGSTGNARVDAPHLHFAITRLGPKKEWWKGDALNPYPILKGP